MTDDAEHASIVPSTARLLVPPDAPRGSFLGGSDVAGVLGVASRAAYRRTPLDVYRAKVGESAEMDPAERLFLERRKRWEPVVIQMLEEELDAEVVAVNQRYRDPLVPYFAAEIDFEWIDEHGARQNGEIKTVHPLAYRAKNGWGEPGTDEIPVEYEAQVLHGLGVTGAQRALVAAMIGIDKMEFYVVERDDETLATIRGALSAFWTEHVLPRVPPDPVTLSDVEWLYAKASADTVVDASDDVAEAALRLRALAAQETALELEREALEYVVKRAMGPHERLTVDGRAVATWKDQKWSRLDQAALKLAHPKIVREFTRSGTHRVFKSLRS